MTRIRPFAIHTPPVLTQYSGGTPGCTWLCGGWCDSHLCQGHRVVLLATLELLLASGTILQLTVYYGRCPLNRHLCQSQPIMLVRNIASGRHTEAAALGTSRDSRRKTPKSSAPFPWRRFNLCHCGRSTRAGSGHKRTWRLKGCPHQAAKTMVAPSDSLLRPAVSRATTLCLSNS